MKTRRSVLQGLPLLLAATGWANAESPAPQPVGPGRSVHLRVLDEKSGEPIQKAKVDVFNSQNELVGDQAQTNLKGLAVIDNLPPTTLRFQVSASTWQTTSLRLNLAGPESPKELRFRLVKSPESKPAP